MPALAKSQRVIPCPSRVENWSSTTGGGASLDSTIAEGLLERSKSGSLVESWIVCEEQRTVIYRHFVLALPFTDPQARGHIQVQFNNLAGSPFPIELEIRSRTKQIQRFSVQHSRGVPGPARDSQ